MEALILAVRSKKLELRPDPIADCNSRNPQHHEARPRQGGHMRGQVLRVDVRTGDRIVLGDDGRRYSFRPDDWAHQGEPAVGMQVDFEPQENRALSLFPLPGAPSAVSPAATLDQHDRNKYVAAASVFPGPARNPPLLSRENGLSHRDVSAELYRRWLAHFGTLGFDRHGTLSRDV